MLFALRFIVPLALLIVMTMTRENRSLSPLPISTNFVANLFVKENIRDIKVQTGKKTIGDIYVTRTKSEYAVYRVILRFLPFTETPLTVSEKTSYILQLDEAYHIEALSVEDATIDDNTWNDFITVNASASAFPRTLQNTHEYVLMREDTIVSNEAYPYYIFSRVGFNDTYTQAIVYLGTYDAPFGAGGRLYYLERVNRQWHTVSVSDDWVTE